MDRARPVRIVWILVAVLAVAHHDWWFWTDRTLVLGFMPIGLFYHALISVLAAVTWALVVRFAWPTHVEEWADGGSGAGKESAAP